MIFFAISAIGKTIKLENVFSLCTPPGILNEVADLAEHCKTMCQKIGGKEVPEELIRYNRVECF